MDWERRPANFPGFSQVRVGKKGLGPPASFASASASLEGKWPDGTGMQRIIFGERMGFGFLIYVTQDESWMILSVHGAGIDLGTWDRMGVSLSCEMQPSRPWKNMWRQLSTPDGAVTYLPYTTVVRGSASIVRRHEETCLHVVKAVLHGSVAQGEAVCSLMWNYDRHNNPETSTKSRPHRQPIHQEA